MGFNQDCYGCSEPFLIYLIPFNFVDKLPRSQAMLIWDSCTRTPTGYIMPPSARAYLPSDLVSSITITCTPC